MLRSSDKTAFVPSRTIELQPESQIDYNPKTASQIKFHLPSYLGFYDPRYSALEYDLVFTGKGQPVPDQAGVHSLFRDIRVQDGQTLAELENIQDYNVLMRQKFPYSQNHSIAHKRELFEGLQKNPRKDANIFWQYSGNWGAGTITGTDTAKTLQIRQPLHTGILGGEKVFPLLATDGLRVTMTLDDVSRSCIFSGGDFGTADRYCELTAGTAKVIGDDAKVAIADTFQVSLKDPYDAPIGEGPYKKGQTPEWDNNPFSVGDALYISDSADGANEELLGIIVSFQADDDGQLLIDYTPDRALAAGLTANHPADSRVYVKTADRLSGYANSSSANLPAALQASSAIEVNYTISNLRMLVQTVSPPDGYVKALESQMKSSKGLALDYLSWDLSRVNVPSGDGLQEQLIPTRVSRGLSVLSVPLLQGGSSLERYSLAGIIDGARDYTYIFGSSLIPDRPVDVSPLAAVTPKVATLHVVETEKALQNVGVGVRDLQRMQDKFLVGRAFSRYGQVSDLSAADLSLRMDYSGSGSQKLFDHFIGHLKRCVISSTGIKVSS